MAPHLPHPTVRCLCFPRRLIALYQASVFLIARRPKAWQVIPLSQRGSKFHVFSFFVSFLENYLARIRQPIIDYSQVQTSKTGFAPRRIHRLLHRTKAAMEYLS
jgi:hypothetical protein